MSLYLFLYLLYILLFSFVGFLVYKKNIHSIYGKYLFSSIIFFVLWFLFYLLSFANTYNTTILLYVCRLLYFLSLIGIYSLFFYVITYYNSYSEKNIKKINYSFIISVLILFFISFFTNLIIEDMVYEPILKIHYEKFGILFNIYTLLYLISPLLFTWFTYNKNKNLKGISKLRFNYITIGFGFYLFSCVFIYIILPTIGIWILQKEQVLFFTPFLLGILYSIYKYHFFNIKIGLGKIFVFFLSLLYSVLFINILKYYLLHIDKRLINFWGFSNDFGIIDLGIGIIIFTIGYNYLKKIFLSNTELDQMKNKLSKLKSQISFIFHFTQLNGFLKIRIKELFNIKYAKIKLFTKKDNDLEIYKYFEKDIGRDLFINDIVFLEENKHKFNMGLIKQQINKKAYLIFPLINNRRKIIGVFEIGTRPFKDQYYTEQIEIIKEFVDFLIGHLKYLRMYDEIHDLNINLDKKVDEKTIEYNTLLNKQKEFISMTSHEIKMPISNSIFQIDLLVDEFNEGKQNNDYFVNQLDIINEQLIKLGELVNKIFAVEKYDIKEIKLFIEKINLDNLLSKKVERLKKINKQNEINLNIIDKIGYIEIDKVQFTQVINNLLNNAIKFSPKDNLKINISCNKTKKDVIIKIEDNGTGFKNLDIKSIFRKYETGGVPTIGMGLGLYLCDKIVIMHNGTIKAEKSKELGGASFIIKIPIKYKLKK